MKGFSLEDRFFNPKIPVSALTPKDLSALATYLLHNDYTNALTPIFYALGGLAAEQGLRKGWRGNEAALLSELLAFRRDEGTKTFFERYVIDERGGRRTADLLARFFRGKHGKFALLDQCVHTLNTSNNIQEIRKAFQRAIAFTGRSRALYPRPGRVNYKSRETKADIPPTP